MGSRQKKASQTDLTGGSQTDLTGGSKSPWIFTQTNQADLTALLKKQSDRPDTINTITRVYSRKHIQTGQE